MDDDKLDKLLKRASQSMLESLDKAIDVEQGLKDLKRKAKKAPPA